MKVLFLIAAYLLGSIPFGVILARAKGVDPRRAGSGNIGATNVMRTAGRGLGLLTLGCDVAKGLLPAALGKVFFGPEVGALAGFSAFLGHLFPLYLRFRGGKGVATAVGAFLPLSPLSVLVAVGVFLTAVAATRMVSVGSILGAFSLPLSLYLAKAPPWLLGVGATVAALVIAKHRGNIERILKGQEHRL